MDFTFIGVRYSTRNLIQLLTSIIWILYDFKLIKAA